MSSVARPSRRDWARRFYHASAADLGRALRRRLGGTRRPPALPVLAPVTSGFLRSEVYRRLMAEHLPYPGVYDRHEAQNETRSYRFRHGEVRHRLGAFRWRGLQEHLVEVLDLVDAAGASVIDLGGAACPVGLQTRVVDRLPRDAYGRRVPCRDLEEVAGALDGVFSSHALEHIEALDATLELIHRKLRAGGRLIVHVPAWSCVRWRAGAHAHALYNDHAWTFGLAGDEKPEGLVRYRDLAELLAAACFEIERAEYCGDDSIYASAVKR